jgi:hypothetical protein
MMKVESLSHFLFIAHRSAAGNLIIEFEELQSKKVFRLYRRSRHSLPKRILKQQRVVLALHGSLSNQRAVWPLWLECSADWCARKKRFRGTKKAGRMTPAFGGRLCRVALPAHDHVGFDNLASSLEVGSSFVHVETNGVYFVPS